MASGKTVLHNFPIPKEEDVPDVAKDMDSLGEAIDSAIVIREEGTAATKPVAGVKQRIYYATDTKQYFIDSGSAWTAIGGPEVIEESNIKKEAISTSKIKLLAIVEGLLADLSVGTKKIADGAVTEPKLATALKLGAWTAPESYGANMSGNSGGGAQFAFGARLESFGTVMRLRSYVSNTVELTAAAHVLCTFPAGLRPAKNIVTTTSVSGGPILVQLTLNTGGELIALPASTVPVNSFFNLDGVTFSIV